ncbi:MAG: hypothetical protein ACHP7N_08130 [Caulobacterales bacterium]
MKKLLLMTAGAFALSTAAAPALADSFTNWNFAKGKFTEINETTQIEKTINVYVTDTVELDSSASSLVAVNSNISGDLVTFATVKQLLPGNKGGFTASGTGNAGTFDGTSVVGSGTLFFGNQGEMNVHRHSLITNSVDLNTGIGQLNQDSGNNSNQGNAVSAAFVFDAKGTAPIETVATGTAPVVVNGDVAKAEAYVEQLNTNNAAYHLEGSVVAPSAAEITADLANSFNSNIGVFMGNQNAGNMNSQENALSAAVGDNTMTALADAGLNQVDTGNIAFEINTVKEESITNSVNHNVGIVMFNQSVGNMNNQATVVNVAALASTVGLP